MMLIAKKRSTGEEREFGFDDLYGYEGEVCGVLLKPIEGSSLSEEGCWAITFNSGYGYGGMNHDIDIKLKR